MCMNNEFELVGIVSITNGDNVIVDTYKNTIVRQGRALAAACFKCSRYSISSSWSDYNFNYYFGSCGITMKFGKSNIATLTTMDDLVTPINASPGSIVNTSNGIYENTYEKTLSITFSAAWAAGVLNSYLSGSEKLGECGIYFNMENTWNVQDCLNGCPRNSNPTATSRMFARVSLGNEAFVPDPVAPVSVNWAIVWRYV